MKRILHFSSLTLFSALNFYFLFGVFLRTGPEPKNIFLLSLLCIGMVLSLRFQLSLKHDNQVFFTEIVSAVFFVIIGAVLTYYLIQFLHLSPVISSSIIGLGASFLALLKRKWMYVTQLPPLIYCGSFVGMTSPAIASGFTFIICSASIAGIFFVLSRNMFHGIGGKLGAVALWAVFVTYFLFIFFN